MTDLGLEAWLQLPGFVRGSFDKVAHLIPVSVSCTMVVIRALGFQLTWITQTMVDHEAVSMVRAHDLSESLQRQGYIL